MYNKSFFQHTVFQKTCRFGPFYMYKFIREFSLYQISYVLSSHILQVEHLARNLYEIFSLNFLKMPIHTKSISYVMTRTHVPSGYTFGAQSSAHSMAPSTMYTVTRACSEPYSDLNQRGNSDQTVIPTTNHSQPTSVSAHEPKLKLFRFSGTQDMFLLRAVRRANAHIPTV